MKIAHLLPYTVRFPLAKHNGRYEWALRLARLQAADGHQVFFYSAPGSTDKSEIIWKSIDARFPDRQSNNLELFSSAFCENYDIYHSHFDYLHYYAADKTRKPIVFTQHWFPDQRIAEAAQSGHTSNVMAVPASKLMSDRDDELGIKHSEIIRQGIDLRRFHPTANPTDGRLIFVGRVAPWKGVLEAVQMAKSAGQPLDIVGKLNSSENEYWQQIEPYIDGNQIRYLGPKDQDEIARLLAQAKAFLFPSQALEAAPQAPIEAQACGTPVIMSDIGATKEWLEEGKTGFIAHSEDEYINSIDKIGSLRREDCRKFAEKFDIKRLVADYYRLYDSLLSD